MTAPAVVRLSFGNLVAKALAADPATAADTTLASARVSRLLMLATAADYGRIDDGTGDLLLDPTGPYLDDPMLRAGAAIFAEELAALGLDDPGFALAAEPAAGTA